MTTITTKIYNNGFRVKVNKDNNVMVFFKENYIITFNSFGKATEYVNRAVKQLKI